ncbi:MAG: ATP-binding protein, partial [Chitinophagaceae bacterium]|nr:ATP-binding protein [Chitinophagaceae bacterium]
PGFTVLLYGYPGTGKTATVKQLARATGRTILMVDIAQIQSKWVGESEKNLTKVFDEYRRCLKYYDTEPILLFNEADAILGKRFHAKSSVDKSFNSLQNILLQQLEDFEGIFIATTNLANHLDDAFDRRFLYKVQFNRPKIEVRRKIFQQAFPDCEQSFLEQQLQGFDLTGGQIMNVKKKMTITLLIEPGRTLQELLPQLIREEVSLSSPSQPAPIGFVKPPSMN